MPVTQRRTKQQIRQTIGLNHNLLDISGGAATLSVSAASSADAWTVGALTFGSSNEHRGKWVFCTGGTSNASSNVGFTRRISGSTSSNTRIVFASSWPVAADTSQTFELWDEWSPPFMVNTFMDQAISEATRKGSVAVRDLTIHTGRGQRSFPFSSASSFIGIQEIEYRSVWQGESLVSMDDVGSSASGVDITTDSEDYKEGAASNRINIPSAHSSASAAATSSFGTVDVRGYTHLEFWAKTNVNVTSSALRIQLGEGSTARETLNIPALNADSWTYLRLALANPELDSAITRFALTTGASDAGSMTVWNDDVTVTRAQTEEWARVNPRFWGLDHATRALVLERDADIPYALLRITGRRAPALLANDTTICEVDPDYVIYSASAKLLRARSDVGGQDPDAASKRGQNYEQMAQFHYLRMGTPQGIRWLENA